MPPIEPQSQAPSPPPSPQAARPVAMPPPAPLSWPKPVPGSKPKAPPAAGKRRWLRRSAVVVLSGFILGVVVWPAIGIYGFGATGAWVAFASKIIPFPAAYVNTRLVRYADFLDDYAALRAYQPGADPAAQKEQVLQKLIADALVEQLAREHRVRVDPAAVPRYVDDLAGELGGRSALQQRLRDDFHLDEVTFIRRVVQPHLLRQAVVATLSARPEVRTAAADNADNLHRQITSGQVDFSTAASRFSQDASARVGGDLGYLAADELTAALGEAGGAAVADLPVDAISAVLEIPEAFSLYRVTERLASEGGGPARLRVWRIVLTPQVSIDALVHDAAAKARVVRFVR